MMLVGRLGFNCNAARFPTLDVCAAYSRGALTKVNNNKRPANIHLHSERAKRTHQGATTLQAGWSVPFDEHRL